MGFLTVRQEVLINWTQEKNYLIKMKISVKEWTIVRLLYLYIILLI